MCVCVSWDLRPWGSAFAWLTRRAALIWSSLPTPSAGDRVGRAGSGCATPAPCSRSVPMPELICATISSRAGRGKYALPACKSVRARLPAEGTRVQGQLQSWWLEVVARPRTAAFTADLRVAPGCLCLCFLLLTGQEHGPSAPWRFGGAGGAGVRGLPQGPVPQGPRTLPPSGGAKASTSQCTFPVVQVLLSSPSFMQFLALRRQADGGPGP